MKTSKRLLSILLMLTMLLSMFTVMASATGRCASHDETSKESAEHYNAKPGTCNTGSTPEYWQCTKEGCGLYFWQSGGNWLSRNYTPEGVGRKDPTNHEDLKLVEAKAATCVDDGNQAYYHCDACNKNFSDAAGINEITDLTSVKIPATRKHTLDKKNGKEATCTEAGYKAYWQCSVCGAKFADKDGMTPITEPEKISAKGHDKELVQHKAVAATCVATGNKEYYECKSCGQLFSDKEGKTETTLEAVTTEKDPSNHAEKLTKVASKAPTCTDDGYKTYWTCKACNAMYSDSHGKNPIQNPVVREKLGHDLRNTKKKDADGKEIWKCTRCDYEEHIAPGEKTYTLKVRITNSNKGEIAVDGNTVNDGDTFELKANEKITFTATLNEDHRAVWTYGDEETTGKTFTVRMSKADATLYVKFVDDDYSDGDYKLTVDISGRSNGTVKLDGEKVYDGDKFWLDKNEEITFRAYPDDGYKVVWTYKGETETGSPYTLKMGSNDAKLYISFVKKSTVIDNDYPTLTFDITGGKHGMVYRGTREYEDGDVISIKKNDKMTFKAKADKGYVAVWTYKGDTYVGDEYTVKMGANDAKLYVEFMDKDDIRLTELPFRDVSKRDWYYDDVVYVYRKGYMDGMSSTRFGGELNTTRGQIVTILWRLTGEPRATKRNPFTDVSSSQYYYDAISWAYDAGVVDGFDAHTFKPDQNVTREQLAAILYRYAEYMNLSTSGSAYLAKYRDADKIANWAYDAMAWANYRGLINGTSATRIDPKGYATRAQIAAILHRFAVEYGA